jgi:hypothetical protein
MFLVYCQRVVNAKVCPRAATRPSGFMAMPRDSGGLASLGSCKYEEEVIRDIRESRSSLSASGVQR